MTAPPRSQPDIACAVCGKSCTWTPADPDGHAPEKFGGWYCAPCDSFTETDVEVED